MDLQKKIDRAIKLIQSAGKIAKEHGQPLEVAYSGGKDSDVILELTRMAGVEYRAIYKNTTIDPPGTIRHALDRGVEMVLPKKTFFEMPVASMRDCSVVTATYDLGDGMKGTIGIIGPRRMDYERVVSVLQYIMTIMVFFTQNAGLVVWLVRLLLLILVKKNLENILIC